MKDYRSTIEKQKESFSYNEMKEFASQAFKEGYAQGRMGDWGWVNGGFKKWFRKQKLNKNERGKKLGGYTREY